MQMFLCCRIPFRGLSSNAVDAPPQTKLLNKVKMSSCLQEGVQYQGSRDLHESVGLSLRRSPEGEAVGSKGHCVGCDCLP